MNSFFCRDTLGKVLYEPFCLPILLCLSQNIVCIVAHRNHGTHGIHEQHEVVREELLLQLFLQLILGRAAKKKGKREK
jgi:hypothetical protein